MEEQLIKTFMLILSWVVSGFLGYQVAKFRYKKEKLIFDKDPKDMEVDEYAWYLEECRRKGISPKRRKTN